MLKAGLVLTLLFTVNLCAAKDTFQSDTFGFSMQVAVENKADAPLTQIAYFFLDGASNVNVQVQKFTDKIEDYDAISTKQFEGREWEIISRKITEDEVVYEYKGKFNEHEMHWYTRTIKRGNWVYTVMATAMANKWEAHKKQLMESVDSFKLIEQEADPKKAEEPAEKR